MAPMIASESYYQNIRREVGQGEGQTPDLDALSLLNPEGVAWLVSPGTSIDYPVVQGTDNDYYLHHRSDGTPDEIGAIFLDYLNRADFSDEVSVLYGHHITLGRMFSPLSNYKEQDYYDQHPKMILHTPERTYDIELFAGNVIDGSGEEFPRGFKNKKEKRNWIRERIEQSTFHSAVRPDADDKMIILCTCSYEFYNARYAVFGRLAESKEES